jgi:hypothetical protein
MTDLLSSGFDGREINYADYGHRQAMLHRAIGDAISRWANLEHAILSLASWALNLTERQTASIFRLFMTSALQLSFTDAVVKLRLPKEILAHWNSLVELARELSGDRNQIAHNPVVAAGEGGPETVDWRTVIPEIGPSLVTHFTGSEKMAPLSQQDIEELVQDFQHAIECLINFRKAVESGPPWPETLLSKVVRRRPSRAERRAKDRTNEPAQPQSSSE